MNKNTNLTQSNTNTIVRTLGDSQYEVITFTLPVTINGETRDIEFKMLPDSDRADSYGTFAARIGQGAKLHKVDFAFAWRNDNGTWDFSTRTTCLNRTAQIVGFADLTLNAVKSQHVGSKIA